MVTRRRVGTRRRELKLWVVLEGLDRGPDNYLPSSPWPFEDEDEAFDYYRDHRDELLAMWRGRTERYASLWASHRMRHPRPVPWAVRQFEPHRVEESTP